MRVSGVLLLLSACTMDPGPPPLQFVADERLASFRLVDVTPRIVPLRGGPVTLSWVGTAADAGSVFHVIVGESVSPAFDNIVGAIAPSPDGGAGQWSFRLPPRPAGTFDLSLIGEVIALDAGRLGALVNAVTYRSTVGTPHFTPLGPTNLGVPLRASLTSPCARTQDFELTNTGDEVLPQVTVSLTGDGFTTPSTCPPTFNPESRCIVKVCFGASTPGVYNGALRATAGRQLAEVKLTATVLEPTPGLAWQRPGRGVFAVSGSVAAVAFEGSSVLTLIDDRAVIEVPLGDEERIVALAGDGAGSFGAFVTGRGAPLRLTSFGPTGARGPAAVVDADRLFGLGRGRVVTSRGRQLTAWALASATVDTTWATAGSFTVAPGFLESVASTLDGRLFLANGVDLTELSPSGQIAVVHQQPARLVAVANDGTIIVATPAVVLRFTSNAWGFVTMASPGLVDVAIDQRQRILLSFSTGTTVRRRSDTSVEATLPLNSVECSDVLCLGAGVDSPDAFVARLAD